TTAEHVARSLGDAVDAIVDGGACGVGIESTIVEITRDDEAVLLRLGGRAIADVARAVAPRRLIRRDGRVEHAEAPLSAPGGTRKHYAPRGTVLLADRAAFATAVHDLVCGGAQHVAVVCRGPAQTCANAETLTLPSDPIAYASALYAALHALETRGVDGF